MTSLTVVVLALIASLILGFAGAPAWAFALLLALALLAAGAPAWVAVVVLLPFGLILAPRLRRRVLTKPILGLTRRLGIVPAISETERVALEAGSVWLDGEIFSGRPDWTRVLAEPYPGLSAEEQAFLDGPVEAACRMTDDWAIHCAQDLPPDVWTFLGRERFFAMIIPKEHGGLAFSARAQAAVITKLASHSVPLAVTVMVPNSLGPAELLVHYGTKEQRARYLPRLARGEEIPCFALTEPEAGSDAGAISSRGEVVRGEGGDLALKLTWNKRYITLAPVATLVGLAFKLHDPDNLLGRGEDLGITCALVPASLPGVELGRRHDPLGVAFLNGPTTGRDVIVPIDAIIGGVEGAGQGWRMLMECLAAGRSISLPSLSVGTAKLTCRVAGAHAAVRRQFGIPIGRFEGIEEPLARIAGLTWIMEATQVATCGGLDAGGKPSVISAIAKLGQTELARTVIRDGMDIVGGGGIVLGPSNHLGRIHCGQPISITVEGANILTRSLIVFGQGVIRCHPFAWKEADAIARGDVDALDAVLWKHVGHVVRNTCRSFALSLSRGLLAMPPVPGPTFRYWQRLEWASASFALLSDVALGTLGGDLKRRERLSGHLADVLSWIYLGTCVLKRFEAEGRREEDLEIVRWSLDHALARVEEGFSEATRNFPVPVVGRLLALHARTWGRINPIGLPPREAGAASVARILLQPGLLRERLVAGTHVPPDPSRHLARLERAFDLAARSAGVADRIKAAMRRGDLPRGEPSDAAVLAVEKGVISADDAALLRDAEDARRDVVQVDSFAPGVLDGATRQPAE